MTKPHRATPEQWNLLQRQGETLGSAESIALLELRARIEALEAALRVRSAPESPLAERVADAIAAQATSAGIVNDRPARAAIRAVAAHIRANVSPGPSIAAGIAAWLEQEAAQPTSQED
jgi:hypothetical protein